MVQTAGWSGSRRLLRELRDVMAAGGSAQQRLDRTVRLVAAHMVAEVCSAYLMRPDGLLELYATEGLKPDAVHRTRMRVGEGLVGEVAANGRPLALSDAQAHPKFVYFPETGEEIYHSLMGAPIKRGKRILGVLVVQNVTSRLYGEEEIETLETIAMVLAELVSAAGLARTEDPAMAARMPQRLLGMRLNGGIASGRVVLRRPRIAIKQVIAEDPAAERLRLHAALAGVQSAIDALLSAGSLGDGEHVGILEAFRMFAADRGWIARIEEGVRSGLTAEAAVDKVQRDLRSRMAQIRDPYIRERMNDLDDLANRVLLSLTAPPESTDDDAGAAKTLPADTLPADIVLVARSLGPAELFDYDRARLRGVVVEEGSPTAHAAIVARALDIPMVGRLPGLLDDVDTGDRIVVDGDHGLVFLRPSHPIMQAYEESLQLRADRTRAGARLRSQPAVTRDGVRISLNVNAGVLMDMYGLPDLGVDGVGLYRTEIAFMTRPRFPSLDEETELYRQILQAAGGRPVVFRALDAGGDKRLPYWPPGDDENPAMGWRAMRIFMDRPAVLRQQLRALIRAANGRPVNLMFPMVSEVAELDQARRMVETELARARAQGLAVPAPLRLGAMLEVPALAFQIQPLVRLVDFLAIGSNDLLQFLFAADRGNPRLANRYDSLSPAALAFLRWLVLCCGEAGVPVSLCGEMAAQPLEAMALLGLGMRSLSMTPSAIGPVKAMVRSANIRNLEAYMSRLYAAPDHSLRNKLEDYARDHGVVI